MGKFADFFRGIKAPPKTAMDALQANPLFKELESVHEAMSKMCEDGIDADEFPSGIGEFGLVDTNPIPCKTVFGSTKYLAHLRWGDGSKVLYERQGSTISAVSPQPIDIYKISHADGRAPVTLFISPYQKRISEKAPEGFTMV